MLAVATPVIPCSHDAVQVHSRSVNRGVAQLADGRSLRAICAAHGTGAGPTVHYFAADDGGGGSSRCACVYPGSLHIRGGVRTSDCMAHNQKFVQDGNPLPLHAA